MNTSTLLKITLGAATAAFLFAGCGDDDKASSSYSAALDTQERSVHYLTAADGRALYTFENDTLDVSNCAGDESDTATCLGKWPRFYAPDSHGAAFAALPADSAHTAMLKHPLYYWYTDNTGDTKGDWVNNVWHLVYQYNGFAETADVVLSDATKTQTYLTDGEGMSLYVFDNDEEGVSNCLGSETDTATCLGKWPVFHAELDGANLPTGVSAEDFSEITRSDGIKQTTYKGLPLYYWFQDAAAGDTNGDWVGGVWHLVELNPANL